MSPAILVEAPCPFCHRVQPNMQKGHFLPEDLASPIPPSMRHVPTCKECDRSFGDVEKALARHLRRPPGSRTFVMESKKSGHRAVVEMRGSKIFVQSDRGRPRGNLRGSHLRGEFLVKEQFPDELRRANVAALKQGYLALIKLVGYEGCIARLTADFSNWLKAIRDDPSLLGERVHFADVDLSPAGLAAAPEHERPGRCDLYGDCWTVTADDGRVLVCIPLGAGPETRRALLVQLPTTAIQRKQGLFAWRVASTADTPSERLTLRFQADERIRLPTE